MSILSENKQAAFFMTAERSYALGRHEKGRLILALFPDKTVS